MDQYQAYLDQLDRVFLSPSVREGFNYWRGLLRGRRFAARSDLDPVAMPSQLHRITLVDVEHDPPRFRTRLLGQHNRDVLTGLLGVSEAEFEELERDGVVGERIAGEKLRPR